MSVRPVDGVTILRATEYDDKEDGALGVSDHSQNMRFISISVSDVVAAGIMRLPDVKSHDDAFSSTPDEFREYVKAIRAMRRRMRWDIRQNLPRAVELSRELTMANGNPNTSDDAKEVTGIDAYFQWVPSERISMRL